MWLDPADLGKTAAPGGASLGQLACQMVQFKIQLPCGDGDFFAAVFADDFAPVKPVSSLIGFLGDGAQIPAHGFHGIGRCPESF
jgi:hypothetical protein